MNGLRILTVHDQALSPGYGTATCSARGPVRSRRVQPSDYSLWLIDAQLETGTTLEWAAPHGDEVVYVLDGGLVVQRGDGEPCPPGGAVVIESDAPASLSAVGPSRVVHFGPAAVDPPREGPLGPPAPDGHGVHVLDARGILTVPGGSVYYADSHCPTCRLSLLRNVRAPQSRIPSHQHSADELVYVVSGDLRLGRDTAGPGGVLAIPAGYRYGLRSESGCEFLNYRRDAAWMTASPSTPPVLESTSALEEFALALAAG